MYVIGKLRSAEEFARDVEENPDWVRVKYKFNRGTLYSGSLPHMATPITFLRGSSSSSSGSCSSNAAIDSPSESGAGTGAGSQQSVSESESESLLGPNPRRVILGLNCFPIEVDECCRRAPEHSGE
jgi:hypothetical protein